MARQNIIYGACETRPTLTCIPEWEELRHTARDLKLYSNSHLPELIEEFEKNATANGCHVHYAKDAEEYRSIIEGILRDHGAHKLVKK